jgi:SAM-dependent methyltransferase
MRSVVYSRSTDRLIYLDEKATPEFWDQHWKAEGKPPQRNRRDDVVTESRKYLSAGSRILEGGCGRGDKVKAMADAGFNAIGVDFAEQSVSEAKLHFPGLDIRLGDVRALEFPEHTFDGYWSFGVIEHFWNGYGGILAEAARVLKPGGMLFLTAPWLSPYRRRKVRAGGYLSMEFSSEPPTFYQFALSRGEVCAALGRHGFQLVRWRGLASDVSLKEEMTGLKRPINWLLGSRGTIVKRVFRRVILRGLNTYCGHTFIAVARRVA